MVAIAIFSVDQTLRRRLEQLPRKDPAITLVGIADSPAALLALAERHDLDVVLSGEVPASEQLADWQARHLRPAWIVFPAKADEQKSLEALGAGASSRFVSIRRSDGNCRCDTGPGQRPHRASAVSPCGAARQERRGRRAIEPGCRWEPAVDCARDRGARRDGGRRLQQGDRASAGHFLPHRQVPRRRDPRQARGGEPDGSSRQGEPAWKS